MPTAVTCSSCKSALKVGDHLAGKRIKCPKCGQAVTVGTGTSTPAPSLSVTCAGCSKKLSVKAELAGKAVKCPGCGKAVRVPGAAPVAAGVASSPPPLPAAAAPAAPQEDEWLDVNEAAAVPGAAVAADGGATGDWGQGLMEEQGVPQAMQEKIRATLSKNERIVWCDRPQMDMLMWEARKFQLSGLFFGTAAAIGLPIGAFFIWKHSHAAAIVMGFMALVFAAVAVYAFGAPARQKRNGPRRACYAITNRRLLVHLGMGSQSIGSGNTVVVGAHKLGVLSYSGLELSRLWRVESRRFPGCGKLVFNRDVVDEPAGAHLWALKDVAGVEKIIREKLLHPIIDKLLRGEALGKEEKGEKKDEEKEKGEEVIAPDENIKDFVRGGKAPAGADANVKDARGSAAGQLEKLDAELRAKAQEELTEGERLLWAAEPEGKTKGRGLMGSLVGSGEDRREPEYELYAITNRRVLLWAEKGTRVGQSKSIKFTKGDIRGPISYYPPHLRDCGLEEDKRFPNGGGIIFKKVKVVITTVTHLKDSKGRSAGTRTKTRTEWHYFGLLRIRNYLSVARLLYDTLIAPVRGL
jgi:hypothetical protein